jgi:hypothetical protein
MRTPRATTGGRLRYDPEKDPASEDNMDTRAHADTERELIETAKRVLPGGTFGNVPAEIVIREGRGGRVWDESGNEYVD